ncbi:MAG: bifunctional folylpolyglutamate synthase/ dihydrofolate synthase [Desulfovibrio sp.]|jgi:dihydrofolate synthase/folylpolyglutamate synthase|nr:bifunctional folylpolyglutamate synthase/ dihydrofolate synthase [Desulfovibrio sp.]
MDTPRLRHPALSSAPFRDFRDVTAYLDSLGMFHTDMSLNRIRRALTELGLTRPPYVVVQILGTNGKGSTAAFLASLCAVHDCVTGLYTSPHFVSPLERIRIDGNTLTEDQWLEAANVLSASARHLTYFEWLTALATLLFRQHRVDVAIFEAGLGGRHDATTALDADLLCFTPIAVDHADILGKTLGEIAADKAGAMRGGAAALTAEQFPEAEKRLKASAQRHRIRLEQTRSLTRDMGMPQDLSVNSPLRLKLQGPHQLVNAGLALAAWHHLALLLGREANNRERQRQGLERAFEPGRLQILPGNGRLPDMILDGAHNPHGMKALTTALSCMGVRPSCAVFSCLADKNWRASAALLKRFLGSAPVFIPTLQNPRAASGTKVNTVWNSALPRTAISAENLARALSALNGVAGISPERPALLTGSLYLLAEFYALHPSALVGGK